MFLMLPPTTDPFYQADKGRYRLRDSDETVVDPDFRATWTVVHPDAYPEVATSERTATQARNAMLPVTAAIVARSENVS
jgi:hypothetical protein